MKFFGKLISRVKIHQGVIYRQSRSLEYRGYYHIVHLQQICAEWMSINILEILEKKKKVYIHRIFTDSRTNETFIIIRSDDVTLGCLTIIEKDPRGGDRFIIIGVIDDRARGSCVGRGSAGGSNPWMTATWTIHQHCKSIRINAISLEKRDRLANWSRRDSMIIREMIINFGGINKN